MACLLPGAFWRSFAQTLSRGAGISYVWLIILVARGEGRNLEIIASQWLNLCWKCHLWRDRPCRYRACVWPKSIIKGSFCWIYIPGIYFALWTLFISLGFISPRELCSHLTRTLLGGKWKVVVPIDLQWGGDSTPVWMTEVWEEILQPRKEWRFVSLFRVFPFWCIFFVLW